MRLSRSCVALTALITVVAPAALADETTPAHTFGKTVVPLLPTRNLVDVERASPTLLIALADAPDGLEAIALPIGREAVSLGHVDGDAKILPGAIGTFAIASAKSTFLVEDNPARLVKLPFAPPVASADECDRKDNTCESAPVAVACDDARDVCAYALPHPMSPDTSSLRVSTKAHGDQLLADDSGGAFAPSLAVSPRGRFVATNDAIYDLATKHVVVIEGKFANRFRTGHAQQLHTNDDLEAAVQSWACGAHPQRFVDEKHVELVIEKDAHGALGGPPCLVSPSHVVINLDTLARTKAHDDVDDWHVVGCPFGGFATKNGALLRRCTEPWWGVHHPDEPPLPEAVTLSPRALLVLGDARAWQWFAHEPDDHANPVAGAPVALAGPSIVTFGDGVVVVEAVPELDGARAVRADLDDDWHLVSGRTHEDRERYWLVRIR